MSTGYGLNSLPPSPPTVFHHQSPPYTPLISSNLSINNNDDDVVYMCKDARAALSSSPINLEITKDKEYDKLKSLLHCSIVLVEKDNSTRSITPITPLSCFSVNVEEVINDQSKLNDMKKKEKKEELDENIEPEGPPSIVCATKEFIHVISTTEVVRANIQEHYDEEPEGAPPPIVRSSRVVYNVYNKTKKKLTRPRQLRQKLKQRP